MDSELINDDRGDINEAVNPRTKLFSTIGSIVIITLGLGLVFVVLNESDDKPQENPDDKKLLTESVPAYELPTPQKSGFVMTPVNTAEQTQVTLTMAELEKRLKEQQALFDHKLAEERRLAQERLAAANKETLNLNPFGPTATGTPPEKTAEEVYQERLLSSDMGSNGKGASTNLRPSNQQLNNQRDSDGVQTIPYKNIDLSVTKTNLVQASRLPNLSYLVPKGVPIPCALNMAIQSDQSGLLTCVTTEDIYSSDGTVILIDRGSNVTGEYRSASISLGKNRIFAIWDRIRTPSGVVVQIDSPAVGPLGRAGIGGYVNNHYLERFGSAVLISLIDDAFAQNSNASLDNTSDTVNDIAGQVLQDNLRIKPTLHKAQGGEVMIIVANDLDFSTVYGLSHAR